MINAAMAIARQIFRHTGTQNAPQFRFRPNADYPAVFASAIKCNIKSGFRRNDANINDGCLLSHIFITFAYIRTRVNIFPMQFDPLHKKYIGFRANVTINTKAMSPAVNSVVSIFITAIWIIPLQQYRHVPRTQQQQQRVYERDGQ